MQTRQPLVDIRVTAPLRTAYVISLIAQIDEELKDAQAKVRLFFAQKHTRAEREACLHLYRWLQPHTRRIETVNVGFIGTLSLLPFAAGSVRRCWPDAFFSLNPLHYGISATDPQSLEEWEKVIAQFREWDQEYIALLSTALKVSGDRLRSLIHEKPLLQARQAHELGFTTTTS